MTSRGVCYKCRNRQPGFRRLRSWAVYDGPVKQAVHRIKYKRDLTLADEMANLMVDFVKDLNWPIEIVVPVPLGNKRKSERGYNQASLIAIPLAYKFGWKYIPKGLRRIRETDSQVGLNADERHANVKDAFRSYSNQIEKGIVLLVDDVATTGATLSSCSQALIAGGAQDVYAITLARAV